MPKLKISIAIEKLDLWKIAKTRSAVITILMMVKIVWSVDSVLVILIKAIPNELLYRQVV